MAPEVIFMLGPDLGEDPCDGVFFPRDIDPFMS